MHPPVIIHCNKDLFSYKSVLWFLLLSPSESKLISEHESINIKTIGYVLHRRKVHEIITLETFCADLQNMVLKINIRNNWLRIVWIFRMW